MNIHFIAIGGSVMHSLALALATNGHRVTGSDDHLYDPAKGRLEAAGLLPDSLGWHPDRISPSLDAVILGMHAFEDNPELLRARELGLPVYSFPEFIFEQSRNKQRVVIAGSYGKSTVTAMIMHVLQGVGKKFDYLVGASVPGFEHAVKLSDDAPVIIIEGDEYFASKLDPRPKFLLYRPHVCLINGIAWDHINVFPKEEVYVDQFVQLIKSLSKAADIVVNEEDERLMKLVKTHENPDTHYVHPFGCLNYRVKDGKFEVKIDGERCTVSVFGRHNMVNISAAWEICRLMAVRAEEFRQHIATFQGASSRLEIIQDQPDRVIIRDYAHAPEKVLASVQATREKYAKQRITACLELHTFSSLNPEFLPRYKGAMAKADQKIVYVEQGVWERRRMAPLQEADIQRAFGSKDLLFVNSLEDLQALLRNETTEVLLLMSSGNFSEMDLRALN